MATTSLSAAQVLAAKGAKLRTHSVNIDRTDNSGYIATHELRDKEGNPPADGQRSRKVYALRNHKALVEHITRHMGPTLPDEEQGEPPQTEASEGE